MTSDANHPQQHYNNSNAHNTSKHESSVNLSSKVLSNELKGSIREDEPRDSWNQQDRNGGFISGPTFGGGIHNNNNGRKTTDMPSYLFQKAAKINGMSGTPQITRNTKRQAADDLEKNIILDSDGEMDAAKMDDTEEHDSLNPKNQKRLVHSSKGQGRKNQDQRLNFYKSVKHLNHHDPDEDDCDVADEDIQINSLSCERQTVNSQGVLSMKDF
jgi:hypothetical protein